MLDNAARLELAPGVVVWPGGLTPEEQEKLLRETLVRAKFAPFYRPTMPQSGKPFSVEETNFGTLGWVSDRSGYRYQAFHPTTRAPWPAIPPLLLALWDAATGYGARPECCLVNLYREGARMGLHQDRDEAALDAPVLSLSLGDDAIFRIGGPVRGRTTQSVRLRSGDVLMFGGPARLAFHGVDRVVAASSSLLAGRLNLTLRRVAKAPKRKDARPGG